MLTPLDDSLDAGVDAGPAKPRGPYTPTNTNQARIKQCCNAMRKTLAGAPEAVPVITMCDTLAAQVVSGTAPEFAQLRAMLKGRTLPAACSGM